MATRVTLYTRPGCHLCEPARDIVQEVCAQFGQEWVERDVDSDPALQAKYGEEIPVVTVDGKTVGFWRIDADILRAALS